MKEKIDFSTIHKIGIVGFSPNPQKDSHRVGAYLITQGFCVYPVYPKEEYIANQKVYHSTRQLLSTHHLDCLVLFRKADVCFDIAKEMIALHNQCNITLPKVFWMQKDIIHSEISALLEPYNIIVVQDACIMVEHKILFNIKT